MPQILLVEDNFAIGQGIKFYLEHVSEHKVTWINHGRDAQVVLSGVYEYDCILLDLNLPGVQGLELLETLRAYNQSIPVIVVTANDFSDVRAQCAQAGATDFLAKPFEPAKLVERINACLSGSTGQSVSINLWTVCKQKLSQYFQSKADS
ncbi:MAG: response regulator [Gammaproteobacteria bacterium]